MEILSFDDLPSRARVQTRMLAFPLLVAARLAGPLGRWCDVVDASSGDAWLWSMRRRRHGPLLVTRSHGLEHREHRERLHDERDGLLTLRRRHRAYYGGERLRQVAGSFRRSDLALFLNHDDLDYAVTRLGVSAKRAHLVRYGLPLWLLGLPEPVVAQEPRVAVIAHHSDGMGRAYSVPALDRLLARHARLRVSLLGTLAPSENVRADFSPSVRERVDVVPAYARVDLPRVLAGHQILLSAKTTEGFGKALLEGMACGLAPVASAASGAARLIAADRTGLLVPPRDSTALADAVERLLAEGALLLQLRRNAHASAQSWTDAKAVGERLNLIETALATYGREPGARRSVRLASTRLRGGA